MVSEATAGPGSRPCTVLYVEDNPGNMRLVRELLGRLPNVRMLVAHEARLGLELAEAHRPDLILLDINLPDLDGYEVFRRLRANEALACIPVIAVSSNAMPPDAARARAIGFEDYLTKPLDLGRFYAAVHAALPAHAG